MRDRTVSSAVSRRAVRALALAAVLGLMASADVALAQSTATVVARDCVLRAAPVPSAGVVAKVPEGAAVEVLGREGDFYRVMLPRDAKGVRLAGFVRVADLALVGGAPVKPGAARPPDAKAPAAPAAPPSSAGRPSGQAAKPAAAARKRPAFSPIRVRGFVDVSSHAFLAADSFGAVFGTSRAVFAGGGGQVGFGPHLFVRGAVYRASLSGERVFVYNDEVFPLGIDDTLTLTPIEIAAGWSLKPFGRLTPFVAGGATLVGYRERADFAESGDNVNETYTGYHVGGGAEYTLSKHVAIAGEFRFTTVPDALGDHGVGQAFRESNLGGTSVHVRVLVGF